MTDIPIACTNHPASRAVHNCLHRAKPICMDCVRARGYFCSDACRAVVQAQEPSLRTAGDEELAALGDKAEQVTANLGHWLRRLLLPVGLVILTLVGWWVYRTFFGPRGQITASLPVSSTVAQFAARMIDANRAVVQADSELFLIDLPQRKKIWTTDLAPLNELPAANTFWFAALHLTELTGTEAILQSGRRTVALDLRDGKPTRTTTNAIAPRHLRWDANLFAQITRAGQPVATTAAEDDDEENQLPVVPNAAELLAQVQTGARPQRPARPVEYTLQLRAADGSVVAQRNFTLTGWPRLQVAGPFLCLTADRDLIVFAKGVDPLWKTVLPAAPTALAAGPEILVVRAGDGITAYAAPTGQIKWIRTDLPVTGLAVGPDGAVYATVTYPAGQGDLGEAMKFPGADLPGVSVAGRKVLLRLDPSTGQTQWGFRNIGDELVFRDDALYAFDRHEKLDLLGSTGLTAGLYSVHCLAPRTGKKQWAFVKKGDLYHHELAGAGKVLLVTAEEPPSGRQNPTCNYQLLLVEPK